MTPLVAYILLFVAVGVGFIFVHLMAGKLIRPSRPGAEKGTIYECGEPTIGSAWVQFDLRFYVVALLFVIFDVEVAFFFPWAEVFGKVNALASASPPANAGELNDYARRALELVPPYPEDEAARARYEDWADTDQAGYEALNAEQREAVAEDFQNTRAEAGSLAWLAFLEIVAFFGVLLVGFAYLWKRGDLAWVRSLAERQTAAAARPAPAARGALAGAGRR
jgi:NADH-quinone oxidoreductase subunit A